MILYPVFVHMYLELVYNGPSNGHEEQAKKLIEKFGAEQEYYYHEDITRLATVTKRNQMSDNDLAETFKSNEFIILVIIRISQRISRDTSSDTLSLLKRHLQEKKQSVIMNIVNEHLYFDLYVGVAPKEPDMQTLAQ